MTARYPDDSCSGRILAREVRDSDRRILLREGVVITTKTLLMLRQRGISEIYLADTLDENITPDEKGTDFPDFLAERDIPPDNSALREILRKQYKQWGCDSFLPVLEHRKYTAEDLPVPDLEELITREGLLTLPEAYYHISRVISSPDSSIHDIGNAISNDPAYTSKLLQLANSSLYSRPNRIHSIDQAVSVIGIRQLAMLSAGIAFTRSFQTRILEASSMHNFLKHSIATAIAARYLAEQSGYREAELFFIAGLLHDLGKMIEYSAITDSAYIFFYTCLDSRREQHEIEKEILGYDHAEAGAGLVLRFMLPQELSDMIRWHHDPEKASDSNAAIIIHTADLVANLLKVGSSGQYMVPFFMCRERGTPLNNLELLEKIRAVINIRSEEMLSIFLSDR